MNEIEALKEKLKQTQLAYQMAAQMSQFKAGFLARTTHELRSPLSSLMGLHQLILSDLCESPEEEREFLNQAYKYAQKLMKIIDEIVAVSKTEYGTIQLEIQPVQLGRILSELYNLTYLQAANRNLQLEISPSDPELYVMADRQRFLQVLVTLVDTAITFTKKGSIQVWLHSSMASDSVQINIDIPCPLSIWSEPVDLLQQTPETTSEAAKSFSQKLELSPGMKLFLSQTLLEVMQGHLEVVDVSPEVAKEPVTRLQCSIPLASAEAVAQELAED
ncbi:MAG: sensor histidine kinase [Xenococcaceae cyanobacterium]